MTTEIIIPNHATPSLNATLKFGYGQKTTLRRKYEKHIWAGTRNQHTGKVRIEIYRHSGYPLDSDNFIGGAKCLVDALKNQKVILDDRDSVVAQRHYEQVKISRKGPKMMVIRVIDIEE